MIRNRLVRQVLQFGQATEKAGGEMNRRVVWLASAAMMASGSAWAQAAPASQAGASEVELEAIVVTAQKREQNLQDVPVAVSAVSGEQLEARGVGQVTDIVRVAPS